MIQSRQRDEPDLWAPVSRDGLPPELLAALQQKDWQRVRAQLTAILDGQTTDGVYGRALIQVAMELPIGVDPLFDRYRAAAAIDHGDWDTLRRCIASNPIAPVELLGVRDLLLAPLDQTDLPEALLQPPQVMFFYPYEHELSQMSRRFRHWARKMLSFQATEAVWSRPDIPAGRHFRHRRLQDAMYLGFAEVQAGRLQTAMAQALEAMHLGDENEPLRLCAPDLEELAAWAMGDEREPTLRLLPSLARPSGLSPLGAWQLLVFLMPLIAVMRGDAFPSGARLAERIAARLGSSRAQLIGQAWRVTSEYLAGDGDKHPELPGLRARANRAGVGLRVLPLLLAAVTSKRPSDFVIAETTARRVGNIWAQISALAWIAALNPSIRSARWLSALLETTGWRRLVLVPPEVAADAALGLASLGLRGQAIVELASAAGRPNVLLDVALRHVDDTAAPLLSRLAAVEALGTLGTSRAGEILARLARRNDELGRRARLVSQRRRRTGLTEREVEVLRLAGAGGTNRDIAERLSLSQHTIARHLANARTKLGAANRTEAAAKLEELEVH
jgi:DNA-binding CsgD family transcriptional regulator